MDLHRAASYVSWSHVDEASSHLAIHTRGGLSEDELRRCFSMMCGPEADEKLWQRFRTVYHNHRQSGAQARMTLVQTYATVDGLQLVESYLKVD